MTNSRRPLAARYNWCQGPVPGRGPAVEKHCFMAPDQTSRCVTHLICIKLCLSEEECKCANVTEVFSAASQASLVSDINLRLMDGSHVADGTHEKKKKYEISQEKTNVGEWHTNSVGNVHTAQRFLRVWSLNFLRF